MTKIVLNDVTNLNTLSVINDNFDKIEQELQNKVFYRNNPTGEPNGLSNDVDANGNSIYNVQDLTIDGAFTVQGQDVGSYIGQAAIAADDAQASATAASNSSIAANASAVAANTSANAAETSKNTAAAIVAGLSIPVGIVKGNGSAFSPAVAGTDYLAPAAIGTSVQAYDADLTTLGAGGSAARTFLGLVIGTDVQAYDANTVKKNVANAYTAQQYFTEATLTDAATVAWDVSAAQVCKVTLGGNRTFGAPTNQVAGAFYGLLVIQDGTGSRTGSWNSVFKFPTATAPTLTTTANAKDFFVFRSDGTNMYLMGKSMDVR